MDVDRRRHLRDSHRRIFVKIAFNSSAIFYIYLVPHHVAQTFDNRTLNLIDGIKGVDDLAADVRRHPDFVYPELASVSHADLGDFRKISCVAEMKCDACPSAFGNLALAPL